MKYIIVDLDDTLLTKDKKVSDFTLLKLKEFQDQGILVVFNTARSFKATLKYIDLVKPDYTIVNGGSQIFDKTKAQIYAKTISISDVNKILDEIKKDDSILNFSIQGENELYSPDMEYCNRVSIANYFDFKTPFFERSVKILISSTDNEKWKNIAKKFNLEFEAYFDGRWCRLSPSTKYKGNLALYSLLKDDDVKDYVFGDDNGDVEMIEKAYHGVYLKNSNEKLLKSAKHITLFDNDNDGIVRYLIKELGDKDE